MSGIIVQTFTDLRSHNLHRDVGPVSTTNCATHSETSLKGVKGKCKFSWSNFLPVLFISIVMDIWRRSWAYKSLEKLIKNFIHFSSMKIQLNMQCHNLTLRAFRILRKGYLLYILFCHFILSAKVLYYSSLIHHQI